VGRPIRALVPGAPRWTPEPGTDDDDCAPDWGTTILRRDGTPLPVDIKVATVTIRDIRDSFLAVLHDTSDHVLRTRQLFRRLNDRERELEVLRNGET
jgi:hypothetical protein